jgi:mono/diheme cytochrome c family protein
MRHRTQFIGTIFVLTTVLASSAAFAQNAAGAAAVRPAGYKPKAGDPVAGEKLFIDKKLSTNGMSCATCHANNASFSEGFAKPYPHKVAMANDDLGIKTIHLDEMIQACMVMPMQAKPLPWNSKELADLTAYVTQVQKSFKPKR